MSTVMTTNKKVTLSNIEALILKDKKRVYRINFEKFRALAGEGESPLDKKYFANICKNLFKQEMNYYLCNGYVYLYAPSGSFEEDILRLKEVRGRFNA